MVRRPPSDLNAVAAFYARWEPYEARRRDIAGDLKELFAEAKATGLNPKSLRAAFAEQYRVENQTSDEAEKRATNDADFELYLSALARVRESSDEFDPETGEVIPGGNGAGGTEEVASVATYGAASSDNHTPVATTSAAGRGASAPLQEPQPVGPDQHVGSNTAEPGDRGARSLAATVVPLRTHNRDTHFLNSDGLLRLHGCQKPELCASGQPRLKLCFSCSVVHDGPTHGEAVA